MSSEPSDQGERRRRRTVPAALLSVDIGAGAVWAWGVTGDWGMGVFCGESPSQDCIEQTILFAVASVIPAALALLLMLAGFLAPSLRRRADLRAQTLGYALIAWLIAGFTFVLGGLPAI